MTGNCVVLLGLAALSLYGQASPKTDAAAQAQKKTLTDAASAGTPLPATINVADNVNIEAVMLPRKICTRVFGKDVSNHYAVIEINISNRSKDAALILQSLYIDISQWGLAGPLGTDLAASGLSREGQPKPRAARASPHEVASVEYRIVRGQLQDAQPWTARNLGLRTMQVLGTIGTAFAFPFTKDVVAGINGWNGAVIPGFQVLFPDGMEAQINRISDYGYRNNKFIPQESADIVVAFFPIERFLPPSLRYVFLDTPAVFFNPQLMAIDPHTRSLLLPVLKNLYGSTENVNVRFQKMLEAYTNLDRAALDRARAARETAAEELAAARAAVDTAQAAVDADQAVPRKDEATKQHEATLASKVEAFKSMRADWNAANNGVDALLADVRKNGLYDILNSMSLNNVHIVVSGVMTVDQLSVPATIESTCFDHPGPDLWASAGDKTCTIAGRFLSGGTPAIADADKLGISGIAVNKDASSDQMLKFTYKLKAPLDSAVTFGLVVNKMDKNGKAVQSMTYQVNSAFTLPAPTITAVTGPKDDKIMVTGTNFYSTPKNPFNALVRPAAAKDDKGDVVVRDTPAESATSFTAPLDSKKPGPGCWVVIVKVGTMASDPSKDKVLVVAKPKITRAKLTGTSLEVSGEQLVNTKDCDGSDPELELLDAEDKVIGKSMAFSSAKGNATQLTFSLPSEVDGTKVKSARIKDATEKVEVKR